jgi:hypothetical protein
MPNSSPSDFVLPMWRTSKNWLRSEGVLVEDLNEPGGGKIVRLSDPDGYSVEIVAGQAKAAADPAAD